jgi:hypothetical protein
MEGSVLLHAQSQHQSESSDEYQSDSDASDSSGELLSSNVGVKYKAIKVTHDQRFEDYSKALDYETVRNKYFTPEITKHYILVETHNHTDEITNNNFVVDFTNHNVNHTSGYDAFDNVIGFRLIKAGIPNREYHITTGNKTLTFSFGGSDKTVTLDPGIYTFASMATHLQTQMNSHGDVSSVTVAADTTTSKFTFSHSGTAIGFDFTNHDTNLPKILGFPRSVVSAATSSTSTILPDFSVHYIDVVIDEIPYIACKRNAHGKNVIDRIGLHASQGGLNYYENKQLLHQNYFSPMKLSKLTISILDDHGKSYLAEESDLFFEFEITILNRV